jgi:hypothetical protein
MAPTCSTTSATTSHWPMFLVVPVAARPRAGVDERFSGPWKRSRRRSRGPCPTCASSTSSIASTDPAPSGLCPPGGRDAACRAGKPSHSAASRGSDVKRDQRPPTTPHSSRNSNSASTGVSQARMPLDPRAGQPAGGQGGDDAGGEQPNGRCGWAGPRPGRWSACGVSSRVRIVLAITTRPAGSGVSLSMAGEARTFDTTAAAGTGHIDPPPGEEDP